MRSQCCDEEELLIVGPLYVVGNQGVHLELLERLFGLCEVPDEDFSCFSAGGQQLATLVESSGVDLALVRVDLGPRGRFLGVPDEDGLIWTATHQQVSIFGVIQTPHSLSTSAMGYLWSERVIVSLKVVTSHNLMVLSCDPVAKLLPLGCTASDSMEFTCAFLLSAMGAI